MANASVKYRDGATLRELYWVRGMSISAIADVFDVVEWTIQKWLKKNDIPTRKPPSEKPPCYRTRNDGYECWNVKAGDKNTTVRVHRLLAVAEHGFDALDGREVHHKNGVRWDNRSENIELLSPSEHSSRHREEEHEGRLHRDEGVLRDLYVEQGLSTYDIAEELDCTRTTVLTWLHKHDIETRDAGGAYQ